MADFDSVFFDFDQMTKWPNDRKIKAKNARFNTESFREPQPWCCTFASSKWEKKFARPREKIYGPTGEADFSIEMRQRERLNIKHETLNIKDYGIESKS